jgi:hypothetical protein
MFRIDSLLAGFGLDAKTRKFGYEGIDSLNTALTAPYARTKAGENIQVLRNMLFRIDRTIYNMLPQVPKYSPVYTQLKDIQHFIRERISLERDES